MKGNDGILLVLKAVRSRSRYPRDRAETCVQENFGTKGIWHCCVTWTTNCSEPVYYLSHLRFWRTPGGRFFRNIELMAKALSYPAFVGDSWLDRNVWIIRHSKNVSFMKDRLNNEFFGMLKY